MSPSPNQVTGLLEAWSHGDKAALDKLTPLVYNELRRLAHHYMSRERAGHTLQTTALVNEAYVRLVDQKNVQWQSRAHFFAVAAQVMRHILIDHARTRGRVKRGGEAQRVSLEDAETMSAERAAELLALEEALIEMEKIDARRSKVVELRYFGGLNIEETAEILGISPETAKRDWRIARAWLFAALTGEE